MRCWRARDLITRWIGSKRLTAAGHEADQGVLAAERGHHCVGRWSQNSSYSWRKCATGAFSKKNAYFADQSRGHSTRELATST
jgi:hypothetical protein